MLPNDRGMLPNTPHSNRRQVKISNHSQNKNGIDEGKN